MWFEMAADVAFTVGLPMVFAGSELELDSSVAVCLENAVVAQIVSARLQSLSPNTEETHGEPPIFHGYRQELPKKTTAGRISTRNDQLPKVSSSRYLTGSGTEARYSANCSSVGLMPWPT